MVLMVPALQKKETRCHEKLQVCKLRNSIIELQDAVCDSSS